MAIEGDRVELSWWEVLKVARDASLPVIRDAVTVAMRDQQPNMGGTFEGQQAVRKAYAAAMAERSDG